MSDKPEKSLIDRLFEAQVGSCSCMVKPPDIKWHAPDCRYRLFTEAEQLLNQLFDVFGIGSVVRTPHVLLANIRNSLRRSDCLSAIEHEFFTVTVEEDEEEATDECLMSWGADRNEYVEQFRAALAKLYPRKPSSEKA